MCSSFHCSTGFCCQCLKSWSTEHPQYPKLYDVGDFLLGASCDCFLPLLTCTAICHFFAGLPVYNRSQSTLCLTRGCCLLSSHTSVLGWPVNICWWTAYSPRSASIIAVINLRSFKGNFKECSYFEVSYWGAAENTDGVTLVEWEKS